MKLLFLILSCTIALSAQPDVTGLPAQAPANASAAPGTAWQYGAFLDAAYILNFNHPSNGLLRSRGTTFLTGEPVVNMAGAYVKKDATTESRWGFDLALHAGEDSKLFGYSPTASNVPGHRWLRHLGRVNVSYLAPAGKGLALQAGLFSSFIGYDSLYAKDNLNYTRPWGADFTPYLMFGVNAGYPVTERLTASAFLVNSYFHLAYANNAPNAGGQIAWRATDQWTLKQTVLIGSHQPDTAPESWRYLSDTIAEWKKDRVTLAAEYQAGWEKLAGSGGRRALWMSAQIPLRWSIARRWSVAVRPEVAWDRDGRFTGAAQTVKAVASTVDLRILEKPVVVLRLEHRFDDSRGGAEGFFRGRSPIGGAPGLTPGQHLATAALLLSFDGRLGR